MVDTQSKPLFLLGQRLRRLHAPEHLVKALVCHTELPRGMIEMDDPEKRWESCERAAVLDLAARAAPGSRFGLVVDGGIGKSFNMTWLFDQLSRKGSRKIPLLLRLDRGQQNPDDPEGEDELHLLMKATGRSDSLIEHLANQVCERAKANPRITHDFGVDRIRHELVRKRSNGEIILLLDGLDHALSASSFPSRLNRLLTDTAWRHCPVWAAGRPYAFDRAWNAVFHSKRWTFFRVDRFGENEIREFMQEYRKAEHEELDRQLPDPKSDELDRAKWIEEFPAKSRGLLGIPRLLKIICDILLTERRSQPPGAAIDSVFQDLDTPAKVYAKAYFRPGRYQEPDTQGFIAQGLNDERREGKIRGGGWIGLHGDETPQSGNVGDRIQRTGALLGAFAFHLHAWGTNDTVPEPLTSGGPYEKLKPKVVKSLVAADPEDNSGRFVNDYECLKVMNTHHAEFLLLAESGEVVRFPDRTVQAFFAAYWAMGFCTPDEIRAMKANGIIDKDEVFSLGGFDEFWQFAAEMPPELIGLPEKREVSPWFQTFQSSYEPPSEITGKHDWIQWHRRMVHHTFPTMERHFADTVKQWRKPFLDWQAANDEEYQAWKNGFKAIPAGDCWVGADPVADPPRPGIRTPVEGFHLHQFQVTNELFERLFGSGYKPRWRGEKLHPLVEQGGPGMDDRCPVVNVTWFDAWCVAAMCLVDGRRCSLPTGLQWEHALRAGTAHRFSYGNDEKELQKYAWLGENSGDMTHPVGLKLEPETPHPNGLFDMEGNVWEWSGDWFDSDQVYRVLRGGSWDFIAWDCRAAYRYWFRPSNSSRIVGFRLVLPGPV